MDRIRYEITGGLGADGVKMLYGKALDLISRVGLEVKSDEARKAATDHPACTAEGDILHFDPAFCDEVRKDLKYPDNVPLPDWTVATGSYALHVIDPDTGECREPTEKDMIDSVKLCDSYGMTGNVPLRPMDIKVPELQEIAMYRAAYMHSREISTGVLDQLPKTTSETVDLVFEMADAAGKTKALELWLISPFKVDSDALEMIMKYRGSGIPLMASTMPIIGVSSPISMAGSYVQSLAEVLQGVALVSIIGDGADVFTGIFDSVRAYPFDMKTGAFVYGSPEDCLCSMMQIEINRWLGWPVMAKSLHTCGKTPDAQSAAEKCGYTMTSAMGGARAFNAAGLLSVDETFSFEQVVIDYEIVEYCRAVCEGEKFGTERLFLDAVEELSPGGSFLEHDSTLENYRDAAWEPALFTHQLVDTWAAQGRKETRERALEIAKERIAEHDYSPPADVVKELDRLWKKAVKKFAR